MSKVALLRAVRDCLRQSMGWREHECAISPRGRPHPDMGLFFVAVHEGSWRAEGKSYLEENLAVNVTITLATGQIPVDRPDDIYESQAGMIDQYENQIKATIHGNQQIRVAACAYARVPDETTGDIFQTPLYCTGGGELTPKGADWAYANSESNEPTFVTRTIYFSDCTRIQSLSVQH